MIFAQSNITIGTDSITISNAKGEISCILYNAINLENVCIMIDDNCLEVYNPMTKKRILSADIYSKEQENNSCSISS